ncbi:hypothetical protein AOQ84DRAFT_298601 [Glonium stellatum]|uniref:Uncharacterized protein n=1 Tax=Glonium stellatum TaxID=574774 RepID=A0A8E2JQQ5_9PEZI|nr:hypothetical protein AOQ84DRAFT_298601 [Glonium stellatum]
MFVTLFPSQIAASEAVPPPYTGNPLRLCGSDLWLIYQEIGFALGVVQPLNNWLSGELDELYPSIQNLICMGLHLLLFIVQSIFLLSLPFCVILPMGWVIVYVVAVLSFTAAVSRILNGPGDFLTSNVDISSDKEHEKECWLFLNGVSVGRHWLQSNVNRLALTFRRPVKGVHNRTNGIIFDLFQCMIERNFCYATDDTRTSYVLIKEALLDDKYEKVVLILHSQGGIQGGLILDWLLDEVPQDLLQQLEIYTFGNAANHFNNPHRNLASMKAAQARRGSRPKDNAVRYIEHYAASGDFVARWGVLNFTSMKNRYMGRVFTRPGQGHLLNQHYLNCMFPLGPDQRVLETNDFMEMELKVSEDDTRSHAREADWFSLYGRGAETEEDVATLEDINSPIQSLQNSSFGSAFESNRLQTTRKVKDYSRLWLYRDGGSPPS